MDGFVSWSGGKDSALACYMAENTGIDVKVLLHMMTEDGKRGRSHGIDAMLIKRQADSMGRTIIQRKTTWEDYENNFRDALRCIKNKGISSGIFGDIDIKEHRDWVEGVCKDEEVTPFLPLWLKDRVELMETFLKKGFKAIVVAVNKRYLDETWLGRRIDDGFIEDLKRCRGVHLCGEHGEYHSFVHDGPIFKRPVDFTIAGIYRTDDYAFLEVKAEE